ncbi:serine hydrolase domain-containing protein [Corynebacterium caspium]|uniref:serine hydrolase domain-containing protein n=1 Tax=Corynebacterium caspium TaxID=234828 RepID=UPI0003768CB3|nr:serine hydrolase domain-containing protein [Corynebacterium caspium]WKD59677.1 putative periplasmic esterase [Corynebacterium caspium DSM 44850]
MSSLAAISSWPVNSAAGAVITGNGIVSHGDITQIYALASVTKLLAAYGFLIAYEEGVWELDTPAGPPGATVKDLLCHRAGVGFDDRRPQRPVGERRIYSSAGYEILADILSAETGMSCAQYLKEAVFEPLGMRATELVGSAGHGANSTVQDLLLFAQEVLNPQLLAPETVALALQNHGGDIRGIVPGYGMQNPNLWGLGFEIKGTKNPHWTGVSMPANTAGHFGMTGTFLWLVPALKKAAVVLTDRQFGPWAKPLWSDFNESLWQEISA